MGISNSYSPVQPAAQSWLVGQALWWDMRCFSAASLALDEHSAAAS